MGTNILCSKAECTGCFACSAICHKGAIQIIKDSEGFRYPKIDETLCTKCGGCSQVCPVLNPLEKNDKGNVYASWANDISIRESSSSGGLFSVFSNYILENGGIVVGASLENDGYVYHRIISNKSDLKALRGSKYVQSNISISTYHLIKDAIKTGQAVLFCGTPCQIAGIKKYTKNPSNLYTIDLVCHGVPSPEYFSNYIHKLRSKYPDMIEFNFRDCKNWAVCSSSNISINKNGNILNKYLFGIDTIYSAAFLKNLMNRECCYACLYSQINRIGDITLADFWGIGKTSPFHENIKQGVSMVSVNTQKGNNLFKAIKDQIFYQARDLQETINGGNEQLIQSALRPAGRDYFYFDAKNMSDIELVHKYNLALTSKKTIVYRVKRKLKSIFKKIC